MKKEEIKEYLDKIYYDIQHPASYSGINAIEKVVNKDRNVKINRKQITDYLKEQEIYTTHVDRKNPKHFTPVTVPSSNWMMDADVAYFDFKGEHKYVLGVKDVFSRRVAATPLKNIKASTVSKALMTLITELGGTYSVRFDRGSEFRNAITTKALNSANIKYIYAFNPHKANYIERFFRQMKEKMFKAMTRTSNTKWEKMLPDIIKSYNNTENRSIGMTPNEASKDEESRIWFRLKADRLKKHPHPREYKFTINQAVRTHHSKAAFEKAHMEQFSPQVYFIQNRRMVDNTARYKLKDENNTTRTGTFAEEELTPVTITKETKYRIEKILRYETIKGKRHALVRWLGYNKDFDTLIPEEEVLDISNELNKSPLKQSPKKTRKKRKVKRLKRKK